MPVVPPGAAWPSRRGIAFGNGALLLAESLRLASNSVAPLLSVILVINCGLHQKPPLAKDRVGAGHLHGVTDPGTQGQGQVLRLFVLIQAEVTDPGLGPAVVCPAAPAHGW